MRLVVPIAPYEGSGRNNDLMEGTQQGRPLEGLFYFLFDSLSSSQHWSSEVEPCSCCCTPAPQQLCRGRQQANHSELGNSSTSTHTHEKTSKPHHCADYKYSATISMQHITTRQLCQYSNTVEEKKHKHPTTVFVHLCCTSLIYNFLQSLICLYRFLHIDSWSSTSGSLVDCCRLLVGCRRLEAHPEWTNGSRHSADSSGSTASHACKQSEPPLTGVHDSHQPANVTHNRLALWLRHSSTSPETQAALFTRPPTTQRNLSGAVAARTETSTPSSALSRRLVPSPSQPG